MRGFVWSWDGFRVLGFGFRAVGLRDFVVELFFATASSAEVTACRHLAHVYGSGFRTFALQLEDGFPPRLDVVDHLPQRFPAAKPLSAAPRFAPALKLPSPAGFQAAKLPPAPPQVTCPSATWTEGRGCL